jgi:DNA-binding MarR family transcriptional regulator
MTGSQASSPHLPGHLDHTKLINLLGYQLAQATIPTNNIFRAQIETLFDLNKLEFTILTLVSSNEAVTPKRLSSAMNVPGPNLTLILDRLEKRELLNRIRSEVDRRVQHVQLTRKGAALVKKLDAVTVKMEDALLAHLSTAERAMLFELLRKVAAHRKG